jgi:hypothetical protein
MKRLLLATTAAALMLSAPAFADTISLSGSVDGVNFGPLTSPDGTLNVLNQSVGTGIFDLNTVTINSESFLAAPGILATNTLNVDQTTAGNHTLILDIKAMGLAGVPGLQNFLSSFSVTGQSTAGWTAREQSFIDGTQLADTGVFHAVADSAFSTDAATIGSLFTAEVIYTINSVGIGQFNGGIDIAAAATPLPAALPMFFTGLVAGFFALRRRRAIG